MDIRLSREDILAILEEVQAFDKTFKVYLYGSRTDPKLKGGDIDLLVVYPPETILRKPMIDHHIVNAIKKRIGDRRIDLSIISSQQIQSDPFYAAVWEKAVDLEEAVPSL